jgi:hypothetical protein
VCVLSSEGWSKSIAVGESNSDCFNVELSGHTQVSWLTEEVLRVVNLLLFKWDWCEVKEVFLSYFSLLLLFLLWLLASSDVLFLLLLDGCLLGVLGGFDLFGWLVSLGVGLKLDLGNWLVFWWENSGDLEHLSGTLAVGGSDDWSMDV